MFVRRAFHRIGIVVIGLIVCAVIAGGSTTIRAEAAELLGLGPHPASKRGDAD